MVRALVVDDSRIMRMVLREHLRACGLRDLDIVEAENGQQALDRIGGEPVGLVVSDVNMPVMDGERLIDQLSQTGWLDEGHAVMVTSRYDRRLFRRLLQGGASTIIRKPFSTDGFLRQMEPVLQEISDAGQMLRAAPQPPRAEAGPRAAPFPSAIGEDPDEVLGRALQHVLGATRTRCTPISIEPTDRPHFVAEILTADPTRRGLLIMADSAACDTIGAHLTRLMPIDDDLRADTVGELANVVSGVWCAALGWSSVFSVPQIAHLSSHEIIWEGLSGFELDDGGRVFAGTLH